MIDIHTHIMPGVDDGSPSLVASLDLIKQSIEMGITDIFLTPHYRGVYKLDKAELIARQEELQEKLNELGLKATLHLGQEIFIDQKYRELLQSGKVLTMNNTKYVLIEFDYIRETDIPEIVYEITTLGLIPIVAHFERYTYASTDDAIEIKNLGGLIQINAESFIGKRKKYYGRRIDKFFKKGLVDFVASDMHLGRNNVMDLAYRYVEKKFGKAQAENVFYLNAKKIIEG